MKHRFHICFPALTALVPLAIGVFLCSGVAAQDVPPYHDPKLPVEQRVADLLSRMTLEEKIAQLESAWENRQFVQDTKSLFTDEKGTFLPERAPISLKYGLGEMADPSQQHGPRAMAEFVNALQKWVKENTRLGIPVLFHEECLHGHVAMDGTSYPQAIALASTWDPALVYDVFSATAAEVRARGAQQCLTPVLGPGAGPALGPHRRDLRRGSLSRVTHRCGRGAGFSGSRPVY